MLITWIAFGGYVAGALFLGWLAHARHGRGDAYWTADRQLGAASVGLSISAGFLSISWSCVYAVQLFYLVRARGDMVDYRAVAAGAVIAAAVAPMITRSTS